MCVKKISILRYILIEIYFIHQACYLKERFASVWAPWKCKIRWRRCDTVCSRALLILHAWLSLVMRIALTHALTHIRRSIRTLMGTVEVQDQVEAVRHCVQQGFVDPARVAVTGNAQLIAHAHTHTRKHVNRVSARSFGW